MAYIHIKRHSNEESFVLKVFNFRLKWLHSGEKEDAPICHGTDPNRNYNIDWLQSGASTSPCSNYYAGPKPFSEPETKALAAFLDENKNDINVSIQQQLFK